VRIQPAMTIDKVTLATALEILAEVFDELARDGSWK
jgi:hypothetical protein